MKLSGFCEQQYLTYFEGRIRIDWLMNLQAPISHNPSNVANKCYRGPSFNDQTLGPFKGRSRIFRSASTTSPFPHKANESAEFHPLIRCTGASSNPAFINGKLNSAGDALRFITGTLCKCNVSDAPERSMRTRWTIVWLIMARGCIFVFPGGVLEVWSRYTFRSRSSTRNSIRKFRGFAGADQLFRNNAHKLLSPVNGGGEADKLFHSKTKLAKHTIRRLFVSPTAAGDYNKFAGWRRFS